MAPPANPKIYHIVHVDRLPSIISDGFLRSDAEIAGRSATNPGMGTMIGMHGVKRRRLTNLMLTSHPDLFVGQCVPFYSCPRSVMLYVIYMKNHLELVYRGGQGPMVHLEANLRDTVAWADQKRLRWAFTLSNAGSFYFEDRCDLAQLNEIDWDAVEARNWDNCKEGKQAEFLVERAFPWELVEHIVLHSQKTYSRVREAMRAAAHRPKVEIIRDWYY